MVPCNNRELIVCWCSDISAVANGVNVLKLMSRAELCLNQ